MKTGIDASNLGTGGGVTHLRELLLHVDNRPAAISGFVVFASKAVLQQLPDSPFIEKVSFPSLNSGLMRRVLFQLFGYDREIKKHQCDLIFSITGDYLGRLRPVVGMSQNMLLYDRFIWKDFRQFRELMRTLLNYYKQRYSFSNSEGIIFISNYARTTISKALPLAGKLTALVHHGISGRFRAAVKPQQPLSAYTIENPFRLLYVSTVHNYKHQWKVVEAVAALRSQGYPLELHLAGSVIFQPAGDLLAESIRRFDPQGEFVRDHGWVDYQQIDSLYHAADAFVFASDCENMPNILIEAMSAGLPVVCSDRNPMPEFAGEYAWYFKSREVNSISAAIERMLRDPDKREWRAARSRQESDRYDWKDTADATFRFLVETYEAYHTKQND